MSSSEFTHHYANLKGVRIHFVTMGQGAPVILIHGWPQTWFEWRRVMPLLADKFTLVAPDMRGSLSSVTIGARQLRFDSLRIMRPTLRTSLCSMCLSPAISHRVRRSAV